MRFNSDDKDLDLVAIGSPHASSDECRDFLKYLNKRQCDSKVKVVIALGCGERAKLDADGTADALMQLGVTLISDTCWCFITEPIIPEDARVTLTNSGKYAHYGPGLTDRQVRLASLPDCAEAAVTGRAPQQLPRWMAD